SILAAIKSFNMSRVDENPACGASVWFEGIEKELRGEYSQTSQGNLVSLMPWLGWAEIAQADAKKSHEVGDGSIPAALALRNMRDQVWDHQLSILDAGDDAPDMVGGIVFNRGFSQGAPKGPIFPTWQSVRPLAFIATMLG